MKEHLDSIGRQHHSLIRRTIEQQLTHEPDVETRNRKPLGRSTELDADWELRFGRNNRFRVFYALDIEKHEVQVLAIGVKRGNRLVIAGEEVKL